jgi:hypothetical protein
MAVLTDGSTCITIDVIMKTSRSVLDILWVRWALLQVVLLPLPILISSGALNSKQVNPDGSVFSATFHFTWDAWLVLLVLPVLCVWWKPIRNACTRLA